MSLNPSSGIYYYVTLDKSVTHPPNLFSHLHNRNTTINLTGCGGKESMRLFVKVICKLQRLNSSTLGQTQD